jgi:predicted ABC-type transport system involved in lysophospholipase L1 biosynthesis ATPase subunit
MNSRSGLSFADKPSNWVLKGVSFHDREGEKVAIVGATGAGGVDHFAGFALPVLDDAALTSMPRRSGALSAPSNL